MAQPTHTDVHLDAILTSISVAYIQQASHFVASQVFPVVRVAKQTDKYYTFTKNDWFRDEAQKRISGTESAGSGYGLSTASYACDKFAIHKDVHDDVLANADAPLNPSREATEFVTQRLLLRQEIQWAADAFATGVWDLDKAGVVSAPTGNQFIQWSDYVNSDPLGDVNVGKVAVLEKTGFLPNALVLGYRVWEKLEHHPDIIDRIKYTSAGSVTTETLARLFGIDRILVCMAVKATNVEAEAAVYAFVHGKQALLAHVATSPGLLTPSAGYTFVWRGVSGGLGTDVGIKRFRMEHLESERVEGTVAFDNKVVATDLGVFYDSVVA